MEYIPPIEGLRGVAILFVIVSHAGLGQVVPGGFGVTLFFFISGFLITRLLFNEIDVSGHIAIGTFYLRRALRLAPALTAMIVTVALIYSVVGRAPRLPELLAAIFYFMNYFALFGGIVTLPLGALWSLAVEEHYYLIYPVILRSARHSLGSLFWGLLAICLVVLLWRTMLVLVFHASPDRTYTASDTRIDSIIYGAILAFLMRQRASILELMDGPVVIAGCIFILLATFIIRNEVFRETARYSLQGVALIPLFYSAVFRIVWIRRILSLASLMLIGRLSYSLYLWHLPTFFFMEQVLHLPAIAAIPVFSLLAGASYYFVERPFRELRGKLHKRAMLRPIRR